MPDGSWANDTARILNALAQAFRPAPEMSISEWADTYRMVPRESGSPLPGRWSTDLVPYTREPMDCLHPDHPARRVVFRASAQIGKTEIGVNWFAYTAANGVGSFLCLQPSHNALKTFLKTKITPCVGATPELRSKIREENTRELDASTQNMKNFPGGFGLFTSAGSSREIQSYTIRNFWGDEVAEYAMEAGERGSPIAQARARQSSVRDSKELLTSTPGLAGSCVITDEFERGDQRQYYMPAPCCGKYQYLTLEQLVYPKDSPDGRAKMACMGCGHLIDNADKRAMLAAGVWIPTFDDAELGIAAPPQVIAADELEDWTCAPCEGRAARASRQPSYHVWKALAPSEFSSWTDVAIGLEEAEGNPAVKKAAIQQILGLPYEADTDAPPYHALVEATEDYPRGIMPNGAAILTGAVDVQGNRFEYGIWGWGPGAEGWLIDAGVVDGDPLDPKTQRALWDIMQKPVATSEGGALPVDLWGVDSGYHTDMVYKFCRGRPGVLALDGRHGEKELLMGTPKRVRLKNRQSGKVGAAAMLYPVGTYIAKSFVYRGLRNLLDGADDAGQWPIGTLHLPRSIVDLDYAKQLTAESVVERTSRGRVVRNWEKTPGRANEALDIAVYCRALAAKLGVDTTPKDEWSRLMARRKGVVEPVAADLFEHDVSDSAPADQTQIDAPSSKVSTPAPNSSGQKGEWIPKTKNWI